MSRTKRRGGGAERESAVTRVEMELPSDRAFVVHLDARARPPGHMVGRVEHVASGHVGHFGSLDELIAFLAATVANRG